MSISYHERPGVYSDYEASSVYAASPGGKTVGLAAVSSATAGLYTLHTMADIAGFSGEPELCDLLRLLFQNGAGSVLFCPLQEASTANYTEAISQILLQKQAKVLLTDSSDPAVAAVLKQAVEAASADRNECIAVLGASGSTDNQRIALAGQMNSARVVVTAPACYLRGGEEASPVYAAAAVAGLIAGQTDPALPFGGASLQGLSGVDTAWEESALDLLIRGGVTPLEYVDGNVNIVRGVTSKTTENGVADTTWKEITTILTVDDVITGVRASLTRSFPRAKNNAQTRSAIRDLVVLELESRLRRMIIDGYEGLTVSANGEDPTICDVVFSFGISHGLSHILLSAHITV